MEIQKTSLYLKYVDHFYFKGRQMRLMSKLNVLFIMHNGVICIYIIKMNETQIIILFLFG